MAELQKPSTPMVNGTIISVDNVPRATKYRIYKVRRIFSGNYVLSDGKTLRTNDQKLFAVNDEVASAE